MNEDQIIMFLNWLKNDRGLTLGADDWAFNGENSYETFSEDHTPFEELAREFLKYVEDSL